MESPPAGNAIDLLEQDHRKVEALFAECESTEDKRAKHRVALEICRELQIHAKIEERIFYPASKRQADEAEDEVNEGIVEHMGIKMLVKKISSMRPSDEFLETSVKVLKEYVRHHVKEEEQTMFPKIEKSGLDLDALGKRMAAAKQRLLEGRAAKRGGAGKRAAKRRSPRRPSGRMAKGGRSRRA